MAIANLMQRAVHYFQNGNLEGAEQTTTQILAKQPKNSDALHLLGVITAIRGKPAEAAMLFKKALARDAQNIELHANLAKALCELGKFEEALASYQKAIKLGGEGAAVAGIVMDQGTALKNLGRPVEALSRCDRALALKPNFAEAWTNKGALLEELHRHEEALACHDKALSINPRLAIAWFNKGTLLDTLRKYQAALASYDQAIALSPGNPQFWSNRGVTLTNMQRYDDALASYEKALSIQRDFAKAHYNEGLIRLAQFDFEKGWPKYEWRRKHIHEWDRKHAMAGQNPFRGIPEWAGEKSSLSLLVWAEQGIGDQILYSSMIEELKAYTNKLMVSLDSRLISIFERSFSDIHFLAHDKSLLDNRTIDRQIPIASIGKYLRTKISDFSKQEPTYLVANSEKTNDLRLRIKSGSKLICGLSWNSKNENIGSAKSLDLQDLLPILSLTNLSFVDLQYGDTSPERLNIKASSGIDIVHIDDIDNFHDIDGLASLIDACDFVVTVSNVTAHLAGALGKKTYLLVPYARGKLWYWHLGRKNSVWYPSVTVLAQTVDGDWQSVVTGVVDEIKGLTTSD